MTRSSTRLLRFTSVRSTPAFISIAAAAILTVSAGGVATHARIVDSRDTALKTAKLQQEKLLQKSIAEKKAQQQTQKSAQSTNTSSDNAANSAPAAAKTTASANLSPSDPRQAGTLQPSPDKPPIPKNKKPLVISPLSVTIYKNTGAVQGLKSDITETTVDVSTGDGRALYYPTSTGSLLLTARDYTPRPTWSMTVSTSYATIGTIDVPLSAAAVDGSASYVGTVHVTVLPLPTFSLTFYAENDSWHLASNNYYELGVFTHSDNFNGENHPVISIENAPGLQCEPSAQEDGSKVWCDASQQLAPGAYTPIVVFENKFQRLTFPVQLVVH